MGDTRWKKGERDVAAALGGVRLPNNGHGQPDVLADQLAVEVKTRKALPGWLLAAVDQSARNAAPGQVPVVVLIEVSRGKRARRLAVLELAALAELRAEEEVNA